MSDFMLQFVPGESGAQQQRARRRPFGEALVDNIVGRDDGVMSVGEKIGTALNNAGESLTLGLVGDEASAAVESLAPGVNYASRRDHYRQNQTQFAEENPLLSLGSVLAPALIPGVGGARMVAATPTLAGRIAASGLLGGAAGGTFGFAEGEGGIEGRVEDATSGALVGGLLGAAAPAIAQGAGAVARGRNAARARRGLLDSAPSDDALRAAADEAYARARRGRAIPRERFAGAFDEIADSTRQAGRDPVLTPRSQRVVDNMAEAADLQRGQGIGFDEIERLRRQAQAPAGMATDRAEQAVGSEIIRQIDDFVADASEEMGGAAKEARQMWQRLRSSETVQEAMRRAEYAGSGYENGLRIEFRAILKSPARSRGLSESVKRAMKEVVDGTPTGNLLRRASRMMSPGIGAQTNSLGAGLSSGAGAAVGSAIAGWPGALVGGAIPPALGTLASRGAQASTRRSADLALALARSGSNLPVPTEQTSQVVQGLLGAIGPRIGSAP